MIAERGLVRMLTKQFGRDYATQVVTSAEKRILTNVINGKIRAKPALQHLALVATELALKTPTLDTSGKGQRYKNCRKYDPICTRSHLCATSRVM